MKISRNFFYGVAAAVGLVLLMAPTGGVPFLLTLGALGVGTNFISPTAANGTQIVVKEQNAGASLAQIQINGGTGGNLTLCTSDIANKCGGGTTAGGDSMIGVANTLHFTNNGINDFLRMSTSPLQMVSTVKGIASTYTVFVASTTETNTTACNAVVSTQIGGTGTTTQLLANKHYQVQMYTSYSAGGTTAGIKLGFTVAGTGSPVVLSGAWIAGPMNPISSPGAPVWQNFADNAGIFTEASTVTASNVSIQFNGVFATGTDASSSIQLCAGQNVANAVAATLANTTMIVTQLD